MGISAIIRVAGQFDTTEQAERLADRLALFDEWVPTVDVITDIAGGHIEVHPGFGWYEPGSGRGHWPGAKDAILAVREVLPGREVYYGTDLDNLEIGGHAPQRAVVMGVLVTDEMLTEYDTEWAQFMRDLDDEQQERP